MSAFLRNIARRGAGLPAEVPVQANVGSLLAEPADAGVALESPAGVAVSTHSAGPSRAVGEAPAPLIQRRAESPAPAVAPVSPRAFAPARPAVGPHPLAPTTATAISEPLAIRTEPVVAEVDRAPIESRPVTAHGVSPLIAPAIPPVLPPAPTVDASRATAMARDVETHGPDRSAILYPGPTPTLARDESRPAADPAVRVERVERILREESFQRIVELVRGNGKETPPRVRDGAPQPRVDPGAVIDAEGREAAEVIPREPPMPSATELPAPTSRRIVNVRIGTLELKLGSPAAAASQPAPAEAAFEGFEAMRTYRSEFA